MKRASCLLAGLSIALLSGAALAQGAPPPKGSGQPPPDMDDPGVKQSSVPLPSNKIPPSVAPAAQSGNGDQAPTVAVHKQSNGDTVEEYRRGSALYMVRITPAQGQGPVQTFMVNGGDGRLVRDPRMGPVDPVYYTIYQWGGPPKPTSESSGG
ncbi:MAG: DUF2782 domain-containing protein [Rhodanobacteraceae bacterium]